MNASTPVISVLALQNEDVLRWLAANGRPESKAALARALGRDKSNLSKSLDAMVREGLLDEDLEFMTPGVHALGALDRAAGQGGDLAAPHAAFKPHPLNPRKDFESAEAKAYLEELSADLVARGQDHNIVCNPAGDDGLLVIRSGETRWRAIGLAVERGAWPADKPIRYVVKDEGDVDRLFGALGENIHRRALNPIEEAKAFEYARDVLGMENAEIAKRVGKDIRVVQLRLQLLKAPPMVQLDLIAGRTTVTEALKSVQQAKAKDKPATWEPQARHFLLMAEIVHLCGDQLSADLPAWPEGGHDLSALVYNAGVGYGGRPCKVFIHEKTLELLDAADLNPRTNPQALFMARMRAGLSAAAIKALEDAGSYKTPWLNATAALANLAARDHKPADTYRGVETAPSAEYVELGEVRGAAAPDAETEVAQIQHFDGAREFVRGFPQYGDFADQVAQALAESAAEAEPETFEMFPDGPPQDAPAETDAEPQKPARDPRAHALRLMQDFAPDVADYLDIVEGEDAFEWAKADMPTLADRMVYYLKNQTVQGVAGMAAAMWARGGEMFSYRALESAWNRALVTAFAIADDEVDRFKTMFTYSATGEIVDEEDGGLIATLEEGVSNEDAAAMAVAPEMRKALLALLAVRPANHDDDEDPESANAWAYAAKVAAAADYRE